ncbi:MAG: glucose-6-phosphate dehydrogenase, partial [Desulfobacca sp.]|nr:glucose-6-phosphate dehydrogenase [Desulfobacca sp.]
MESETTVKCQTPDLEIPFEKCLISGELSPFIIIILGASGDLTARKLIPALYNLYLNQGFQANPFIIMGAGRSKWSQEEFQEKMRLAIAKPDSPDLSRWPQFARCLYYQPLEYDDLPSFLELDRTLKDLDGRFNLGGNKIFYLALPPTLFPVVTTMLGQAGLSQEKETHPGWTRLIVEKPFGRDLKTALELDRTLHENFLEHQIFRIDHYLAKE